MRSIVVVILAVLSCSASAQRIQRWWSAKDYEAIYAQLDRVDRMRDMDMLRVAQSAAILGHDSEAIYVLDLAERKGYAGDQHYYVRGEVYFKNEMYGQAAADYREALELNANRLPYMMALANAYYYNNQADSALKVYHAIHDLYPDKDVATFAICKIPTEEGYLNEALKCWRDNMSLFVDEHYRIMALEEYSNLLWYGKKDTAAAKQQIDGLIRLQPDVIKYRLMATQINAELGHWDEVETHLNFMREEFAEGQMPIYYIQKNNLPILDMGGKNNRLQIIEILNSDLDHPMNEAKWICFVVTPQHGILVNTWKYVEKDGVYQITNTEDPSQNEQLDAPLSLQEFYIFMVGKESNLR